MKASKEISIDELKRLLSIRSDKTIHSYFKAGVIKKSKDSPYSGIVFDRQHVLTILGIKDIPDEPFIGKEEAAKIMGLSESTVTNNRYAGNIPHYRLLKPNNKKQVHKYLFLRSEIEAAAKNKLVWDDSFPHMIFKNFFIREILLMILGNSDSKWVKKKEFQVLRLFLIGGKDLAQIGKEVDLTPERVRQLFHIAIKRVYWRVKKIVEYEKQVDALLSNNVRLHAENKVIEGMINDDMKHKTSKVDILATSIDSFDFGTRVRNILYLLDVKHVGDLVQLKRSDLFKYRNVGETTVTELDKFLKRFGLSWRDPNDDEINDKPTNHGNSRTRNTAFNLSP